MTFFVKKVRFPRKCTKSLILFMNNMNEFVNLCIAIAMVVMFVFIGLGLLGSTFLFWGWAFGLV